MTTRHGLNRSLKWLDTLALAFGAMVGWAWVALISDILMRGGSLGSIIGTAIVGLVILAIGFIYAELTSAMPNVGGEHVYSKRALGGSASFICTWAIIFVYVAVCAFEAVALPSVIGNLIPSIGNISIYQINGSDVYLDMAMIGAVTSLLIAWINIRGVKLAAFVQTVVVGIILLAGAMLILGLGKAGNTINMDPLFVGGFSGMFAAMAMIPFLMTGFDVIPQAAEEINLPPKKIGYLLIASIVFAVSWYILIELAVSMLLTPEQRINSPIATMAAAEVAFGKNGGTFLLLAGIAGILTSWNSFMIGGSRAIFAMAQDGMLPKFLAKVHPKYKTPYNAILFIGILGAVAPFLGRKSLVWFVDGGSFSLMIAYFLVCVSFIVLRNKEPEMNRPFKAKGGKLLGWFGVFSSLAIATLYFPGFPAALVWQEWLLVIAWFVLGALSYFKVYKPFLMKKESNPVSI